MAGGVKTAIFSGETIMKTIIRLAFAAALVSAGTGVNAAVFNIDAGNATNGIYDIYSATFDAALTPCTGGSPSYCAFFGGDPPAGRAIAISPNPTGVIASVPGGIAGPPAAGSFLDIDLTAGNTMAQVISDSTITFQNVTLTIAGSTVVTASGAGMVIKPSGVAAVNGSGQVEFLVDSAPSLAADFSTLGAVVTGCTGPLCSLLGALNLDMVRYRLFLDFDPTFTHFTGSFIGQTANNSLVYANLTSVVPVPATVWLMASALAGLFGLRRRALKG